MSPRPLACGAIGGRVALLHSASRSYGGKRRDHPFVSKYISAIYITIRRYIATVPYSRDAVARRAELELEAGNLEAATSMVEALDRSAIAAVSLAVLYLDDGRNQGVVSGVGL